MLSITLNCFHLRTYRFPELRMIFNNLRLAEVKAQQKLALTNRIGDARRSIWSATSAASGPLPSLCLAAILTSYVRPDRGWHASAVLCPSWFIPCCLWLRTNIQIILMGCINQIQCIHVRVQVFFYGLYLQDQCPKCLTCPICSTCPTCPTCLTYPAYPTSSPCSRSPPCPSNPPYPRFW